MKEYKKILACLGGFLLLMPIALGRPEPNAFLNQAAPNLQSVIRQVKTDPQVLDRYQRHFGMNKAELVAYFESLKLLKLTKGGPYIVYNCREKDGVIGQRIFHLKAGTLLYVDSDGVPVLKFSCGNPMSKGPSKLLVSELVLDEPVMAPADVKLPDIEGSAEPQVPEERMVVEELAEPTFVPEPPIPPVLPPITPEPPVVKPSYEAKMSPALWLLPLLSASLITNPHHGSNPPGPPPVPDPATIIGLGGLCTAYFANSRKRNSRSKKRSLTVPV